MNQIKYNASVIIPTYNRVNLLRKTLQSLVSQTHNRFEVIVSDDGSSEDNLELIRSFEGQLEIKFIYHQDTGFAVARARNLAASIARSDLLIFIDTGVILPPDAIERQYLYHQENAGALIGIVHGDLHSSQHDHNHEIDPDVIDERIAQFSKYGYDLSVLPCPWIFFWSCYLSIKKPHFLQTGGFDEYFTSWGGEDVELGIRLHKQGIHLCVDKNIEAFHIPHERQEKLNIKTDKENREYIISKHHDLQNIHLLRQYGSRVMNDIAMSED
ncbi:glycosyltransferase [Photobacterium galatheae]|uniref:Glycosyl transferase n=1 Tax=Photobacterium galatheae TaxID=1654360 RepID=A0A066RHT5_9GAMM|nr:glycosyltransferase [Photobacterium galatheae]KDM90015.1 hypothetical protein EA58_18910 [Photobacterium galatheae]MCM0149996.1 glycosyltransferase [Photobacterium galatheae]